MSSAPGARIVHTIGHSTRTLDELAALLVKSTIRMVVDVRAMPRSRRNPQFNIEALPASLAEFGIGYRHLAELGGRRHRPRGAPPSPNTYWRNDSFRNYADYAMTPEFASGMELLRELSGAGSCAIMCSEAVWWRCHRRIISDYLLAEGFDVLHILGPGQIQAAEPTPGVSQQPDRVLTYPA